MFRILGETHRLYGEAMLIATFQNGARPADMARNADETLGDRTEPAERHHWFRMSGRVR